MTPTSEQPPTIHYIRDPQNELTTLCGLDIWAHIGGGAGPVLTLDRRRVTCKRCLAALALLNRLDGERTAC